MPANSWLLEVLRRCLRRKEGPGSRLGNESIRHRFQVPAGELDVAAFSGPTVQPAVWGRLERELRRGMVDRPVVLDLQRIQSLSTRGVRSVLRCQRVVESKRARLAVCGLNGPLRTLFQVSRLHELVEVFSDAEEAGAALLRPAGHAKAMNRSERIEVRRSIAGDFTSGSAGPSARASLGRNALKPTSARPLLIGIAGGSCAGKTTLAQALGAILGEDTTTVVGLDSYYRDLPRAGGPDAVTHDFDGPEALDAELLFNHLRALARGESVQAPVYDLASQRRTGQTRLLPPRPYVVVEGNFTLYWPELRNLLDLGIFVDARSELCLERRVRRDVSERSRKPDQVAEQYLSVVRPMHVRHVEPTRELANLVVAGEAPLDDALGAIVNSLSFQDPAAHEASR